MAPQYSHQQPFQPFVGVPQADPMNDARRQDPPAFSQPQFSARHRSRSRTRQEPERETRRDSHSRPRQEPEPLPRRDSVDSDKIRHKEEVRKSPPSSNGRSPKYIQQQRLQREPRVYMEERPRMQRHHHHSRDGEQLF